MTANTARITMAAPRLAYLSQREEIDGAIRSVLEQGQFILGPRCEIFEQTFAKYIGVKHGIAVANGTDAISLALQACGITSGQGVLTATNTAGATIAAIEAIGAIPILADVDDDTLTICPHSAQRAILRWNDTYPIRAVIPVHLYGQSAPMDALMELAGQFDLVVVEDCSQAHGSKWDNKMVGSFGHAAAYSFYPTKNLGAFGDAGIVVTNHEKTALHTRSLRQYGWQERYISNHRGSNSRMDEIQAAILDVRFKALAQETRRRQEIAERYLRELCNIPGLRLPVVHPLSDHVYHQFVIRHSERDELAGYLEQAGIDTAILYPVPIHQQPAWQELPLASASGLPLAETSAKQILSLPIHPFLTAEEVGRVIKTIREFPG